MNPILMALILVTVIGLIGAVILVAASIVMYVPVDERVEKITGVLAGANCGACGCAGCADYAIEHRGRGQRHQQVYPRRRQEHGGHRRDHGRGGRFGDPHEGRCGLLRHL